MLRTTVVASALVCLLSAPALAQEPAHAPPPAPVMQPATSFRAPGAPDAVQPAAPAAVQPAAPVPEAAEAPPAVSWVPETAPAPVVPGAPAGPERDGVQPEAKPKRSWNIDVGVTTEFPLNVGGYVGAELPGRLLLQVGAGTMPSAYSGAVNSVLTSVGAYDANLGNFIHNAISNSFVLRLSGGWRPFADHGLEILGGYTLVTLGGSATEGDIINAVLQEAGSSYRVQAGSGANIPISATMHNFHVTLGWRWLLADDHLVLRAALSYMQCVAANVGVTLPSQASAMEPAVNQALNGFVSPFLTGYVKTPLVGLSAAYRF